MSAVTDPEMLSTHGPAVMRLYQEEALLLQRRQYDDWLRLFEPDLRYRLPTMSVVYEAGTPRRAAMDVGYYDDDVSTLTVRITKMKSAHTWSEVPASALRYFVQLLHISQTGPDEIRAVSNLLVAQSRDTVDQIFSGERVDDLRLRNGSPRVFARTVELDRRSLARQALTIFF